MALRLGRVPVRNISMGRGERVKETGTGRGESWDAGVGPRHKSFLSL